MEIVTATDAQVITISERINQTLLGGMESRSSHLARHSSARHSMDPRRLSRSSTVILPESDSHRRRRLQLPQLNVEVGRTTFKDSQRFDGPRGNITPQHAPPYELITSVRDQNATDTLQNWLATTPKPPPKSAPPDLSDLFLQFPRELTDSLPEVEVNGSSPSPEFK
ncbi:hypothetical protein PNOK_0014200 [Pyrrhoderma noxium]|uniref:Uncharacterized protein n=1 Tax=Pyrrhoderma noxium TaxID=2282107 RepID=A0A286UUD8_9AGAM|nr:hypothetical protein PNOK_0014200 [Pyrrhoderma noxium]